MIGVFTEPGFFARKLFEVTFGGLRTPLLQPLAQGLMPSTHTLYLLTTEYLTLAIGRQIDDSEVDAQGVSHHTGSRGGRIQRHRKVEYAFAVEQVRLSLDASHASLLICSDQERNQHTARKGQQRNGRQPLEGHHPLIIDDSAKRAARLSESLSQHWAEALLFRKLATLREDVPLLETLADLQWQGADARLKDVCHRLGDEKFPGRVPRWRER